MNSHFTLRSAVVLLALTLSFTPNAFASSFVLGDHPDGNQSSRGDYGIRLDSQQIVVGGQLEGLLLSVDGLTLTVTGPGAAGAGLGGVATDQNGTLYAVSASFDVINDATFDPLTGEFTASGGQLSVTPVVPSAAFAPLQASLASSTTHNNLAFLFLNDGHRAAPGFVGRGWLDLPGTNDFLFTASPVPLPAAVWFFGSGIMGLVVMRRRKQVAQLA